MPRKRPRDFSQAAKLVVDIATSRQQCRGASRSGSRRHSPLRAKHGAGYRMSPPHGCTGNAEKSLTKDATMDAAQEIMLPDGGKIIRFDPPMNAHGCVQSLMCLNADGSVRWKIAPPYPPRGQTDFFVAVKLDADRLLANSWGCYLFTVDPKTGATSNPIFTK
jgi:hypothetical protein